MLAFIGSVIGAVAGIGSTLLQNNSARKERRVANDFTREQLQNQHQWQVEDLKKAGLNPVLSANSGAGTGASHMAPVVGMGSNAAEGVASALALKKQSAEVDAIKQNEKTAKANESVAKATEKNIRDLNVGVKEQAKANANAAKIEAEIDDTKYGKFLRYLGRLNPFGSNAAKIAPMVIPGPQPKQ